MIILFRLTDHIHLHAYMSPDGKAYYGKYPSEWWFNRAKHHLTSADFVIASTLSAMEAWEIIWKGKY